MTKVMELRRSNLVLPTSGYELDREEMCYVDGGGAVLVGNFSANSKAGIEYLNEQSRNWGIVSGLWLAVAVVGTIGAIISSLPTAGLGALIYGAIATFAFLISSTTYGIMQSANDALIDAMYAMSQGKSYSVYRQTGLFGITTGFSVKS